MYNVWIVTMSMAVVEVDVCKSMSETPMVEVDVRVCQKHPKWVYNLSVMFMIKLFNKNIKNYVWSLLFFWTT